MLWFFFPKIQIIINRCVCRDKRDATLTIGKMPEHTGRRTGAGLWTADDTPVNHCNSVQKCVTQFNTAGAVCTACAIMQTRSRTAMHTERFVSTELGGCTCFCKRQMEKKQVGTQ